MTPTEVSPIAPGFRNITPFLMVDGVAAFLDFLRKAFDVQETRQYAGPNDTIAHAEVRLDDSVIMIGDPMGKYPLMPGALYFYVTNVDSAYKQALDAGAISIREPIKEFYGDRVAGVRDRWGNTWWLATHVEDVGDEELQRRNAEQLAAPVNTD